MDVAVSIALRLLLPARHENTRFASSFGLSIPYFFTKSAGDSTSNAFFSSPTKKNVKFKVDESTYFQLHTSFSKWHLYWAVYLLEKNKDNNDVLLGVYTVPKPRTSSASVL
jgi:hypothetical protein